MTAAETDAYASDETPTDEARTAAAGRDDRAYTRRESVLITGCSSGIGRATARAFLDEGWRVYATARRPTDVADLADAGCETAALDVTDHEQAVSVVDRVVEEAGAIDCLVNNAGYARLGPLEDVTVDELHHQFAVNVYGPHRLTRAALPHMRENGDGTIVNVSSISGQVSTPGSGAYAGSKFALEAMSDALRGEVASFGVDVVLIEPGPVTTNFTSRVEEELPGERRSAVYEPLYEMVEDWALIGHGGPLAVSPEAVAATILQAASCTDPAPRYPVGPIAKYGSFARYVPETVRDRVYGLVRRFV